jgi:hypothetical protein
MNEPCAPPSAGLFACASTRLAMATVARATIEIGREIVRIDLRSETAWK